MKGVQAEVCSVTETGAVWQNLIEEEMALHRKSQAYHTGVSKALNAIAVVEQTLHEASFQDVFVVGFGSAFICAVVNLKIHDDVAGVLVLQNCHEDLPKPAGPLLVCALLRCWDDVVAVQDLVPFLCRYLFEDPVKCSSPLQRMLPVCLAICTAQVIEQGSCKHIFHMQPAVKKVTTAALASVPGC